MKRILASALVFLFLFNTVGYYLLFLGLRYQARVELNQRFDEKTYAASEIVSFKIPITLPYNIYETDYERIDGAFEHNGEFFKLVTGKIKQDTLYIVCYKDHKEKELFNAMTDFVKLSNDLPTSSKHTVELPRAVSQDFFPSPVVDPGINEGLLLSSNFKSQRFDLIGNDLPIFSPPPDL